MFDIALYLYIQLPTYLHNTLKVGHIIPTDRQKKKKRIRSTKNKITSIIHLDCSLKILSEGIVVIQNADTFMAAKKKKSNMALYINKKEAYVLRFFLAFVCFEQI